MKQQIADKMFTDAFENHIAEGDTIEDFVKVAVEVHNSLVEQSKEIDNEIALRVIKKWEAMTRQRFTTEEVIALEYCCRYLTQHKEEVCSLCQGTRKVIGRDNSVGGGCEIEIPCPECEFCEEE